jgi:hypothetical protein
MALFSLLLQILGKVTFSTERYSLKFSREKARFDQSAVLPKGSTTESRIVLKVPKSTPSPLTSFVHELLSCVALKLSPRGCSSLHITGSITGGNP